MQRLFLPRAKLIKETEDVVMKKEDRGGGEGKGRGGWLETNPRSFLTLGSALAREAAVFAKALTEISQLQR